MKAYKNEQPRHSNSQPEARLPYEPPRLTVMGKVEDLTALLFRGVPDLLSHGNVL